MNSTTEREQQVGRERREELRQRLHPLAPRPGRSPIQTPTGTQIRLASAISTTTRSSVSRPSPTAVHDVAPARASAAMKPTIRQSAQAEHRGEHREPDRRRQRATAARAAAAPARPECQRAGRRCARDRVADRHRPAARSSRVRRSSRQHPGIGGGRAGGRARSGTCRPRRPAAGTATGRRAGSPTSMASDRPADRARCRAARCASAT